MYVLVLVQQDGPPTDEGAGAYGRTFGIMHKNVYWVVEFTKMHDAKVQSWCHSHRTPFSKMADLAVGIRCIS